jgi:hypothetical protein
MTHIKTGAAVLAAIAVLTSCSNDDPAATPEAGSDEPTTPSGTPSATYEIVPSEGRSIRAGSWAIRAAESAEVPLAVIDVPTAGFTGGERWIWTNEAVLGYWTVSGVHTDPCTRSGPAGPTGDTVGDLAAALDVQRLTTATDPVPVAVDGHDGLYLEVSTPADLDYGTCRDDAVVAWDDAPAWSEAVVTRLWILDVDGQRVVLTLNGEPTKATERVFTGMVRSAEFVEG